MEIFFNIEKFFKPLGAFLAISEGNRSPYFKENKDDVSTVTVWFNHQLNFKRKTGISLCTMLYINYETVVLIVKLMSFVLCFM